MTKFNLCAALAAALPLVAGASHLHAQEPRFTWEGEIELGFEDMYRSDVAADEFHDVFGNLSLSAEYAFSDTVSVFGEIVGESMTDPFEDRAFENMGLYLNQLGIRFSFDNTQVSLGKIAPTFGTTWDSAAGYFGGILAEDYEFTEAVGGTVDVALGNNGVLSMAVFFSDTSVLSESAWYNRGRNTTAAGGAGNTGKLNNYSLAWTQELDNTVYQIAVRRLSAGTGDVSNETGVVASVGHTFDNGLFLFAEAAAFDGFGGSADKANYLTLNSAYGIGNVTLSATLAHREIDNVGDTDVFSLAAEYELENGITFGGGLAFADDAGVKSQTLGLNVVIPFPLGG